MPHCFNATDAVDPDTTYYRGPGWYRTNLRLTNPFSGGRILLHFEGAGQTTAVFVGQEKAGEHVGGYDEFTFDITDLATKARQDPANHDSVPVAIVCDNSRDLERLPSDLSDFNLYGGAYRYINLEYVPAVSIERVHVSPKLQTSGAATVTVSARLYNPLSSTDSLRISLRVLDPNGREIQSKSLSLTPWSGDRDIATFEIARPDLWSPARPALYRCEMRLESSHGESNVPAHFGLRSYEFVTHGPFKLNGERLLIRGTQRHEDHAGLAAAMTEDLIRREMRMIKDMGANFIRLAHYQQSRIVLDCCDELGIMVWEEIPWCRSGIGGERWQAQARASLPNLIDQHYNHPAVVIWGLGNENDWPGEYPTQDQGRIRAFLSELNDTAHQLDPSRVTGIRRCEFAKDIPDVYSPSIWAGWYRGRYTEYKSSSEEEMKKVNHFIHMEWGADSHAGRHSEDPDKVISSIATGKGTDERGMDYLLTGGITRASSDGDWSETYACNLFDWHLKEQETMPWLTGAAQWIFKDFSTPVRPENPLPKVNEKGLTRRDLTPKESYYVFQSYWTDKPMAHIYGHTWPVRWGSKGESKVVKVYSNCDTAELFCNGASQGVKKRNSQDFPAAGLRWLVPFREGENHLRAVAKKGGAEVADEISFQYTTEPGGAPARLEVRELRRSGENVTVEATLMDAKSVPCLDARNVVRFELAGDGTLIADLGLTTAARVVQLTNGRAEITLRRNDGKSELSVSSQGIPTALLEIV
jgi:beta-galactosidase